MNSFAQIAEARVAVLMPTYNRRATLGQAIAGVIAQEYKDWALMVVNDGGVDVDDIIAAANDRRVHYIKAEHGGKSAAMNLAIAASDSEYIAYLDDDDAYLPNHLRELAAVLEANPGWEWACSQTISESWRRDAPNSPFRCVGRNVFYDGRFSPEMIRFSNQIPNLNVMHRRGLFKKVGFYDAALPILIDWDMYRRFSYLSDCHAAPVVTGVYRKFEGQEHIGALGRQKPDLIPAVNNRIRARVPGITTVLRLKKLERAHCANSSQGLSIAVCAARHGSDFESLAQALIADASRGGNVELLLPGNVFLKPLTGVSIRNLPVALEAGAGAIFQAAMNNASCGRLVMLRSDMRPAPGFINAHLAETDNHVCIMGKTMFSRVGWKGPAADLVNPLAVPALVSVASFDSDSREFFHMPNEWAAFNFSMPLSLARDRLAGFDKWGSPIWFKPFFELWAPVLESNGCYVPKASAQCRLADPEWNLSSRFAGWGRALAALWDGDARLEQARAIAVRYMGQTVFLRNMQTMLDRLQQAQAAGSELSVFACSLGIPTADLPDIMGELARSSCEHALLAGLSDD